MAKRVRTIVTVIDDLTGEEQPEGTGQTVHYALDGKHYEIDLSDKNAEGLRELLAPIIRASRRQDGRRIGSGGRAPKAVAPSERAPAPPELPAGGEQPGEVIIGISVTEQRTRETAFRKEVRAWARANGFPEQKDTGKLYEAARQAWNAAHPDRPVPEPRSHR